MTDNNQTPHGADKAAADKAFEERDQALTEALDKLEAETKPKPPPKPAAIGGMV